MPGFHFGLFTRIAARNREVYILKIVTLAVAFTSSILIILFSLNEFGYDRFHQDAHDVFRVLQRNNEDSFSGNRLSAKVPTEIYAQLKSNFKDSLVVSRVKIMNNVTVVAPDGTLHYDQKIHAADSEITDILSFAFKEGQAHHFSDEVKVTALLSTRAALAYTGTPQAVGRKIRLSTLKDTVEVTVAAVFHDFPTNSHEDFEVLIRYDDAIITALSFNPNQTGVYGRTRREAPAHYALTIPDSSGQAQEAYSLQPLPELYFGPRVRGEDARHGDRYSVIILICIAGLILFLSISSFVNLTTITLPYRSKELAIKKLAGTSEKVLLMDFVKESSALVGISLVLGLVTLVSLSDFFDSMLKMEIISLMRAFDLRLIGVVALLFVLLAMAPVVMTRRFVQATPNRLLSTDTIRFPRLKRVITFFQLGISIFLIVASVVVRRQINYSLVKEPGQNHDQILFLNSPAGITNEGVRNLRSGWRQFNPNILDVMAVSQLPDRIISKEIGSDFYLLQADAGFKEFFGLQMQEGYWFGPNADETQMITNRSGRARMTEQTHVLGVVDDFGETFNQPEKPLKIALGKGYHYNWLCVRVLEVDIRRTVEQLSRNFSHGGDRAQVNYLDRNFRIWVDYQDRLNKLSAILAIVSGVLSCFAIYGLSVSLVRDKLKEIAVHKLFGARTLHVTYLLVREFILQMAAALVVFGPIAYMLLNELLRTFVFSTKFLWTDPVYPIAYCVCVITVICVFQALSLNRTDVASALKG